MPAMNDIELFTLLIDLRTLTNLLFSRARQDRKRLRELMEEAAQRRP